MVATVSNLRLQEVFAIAHRRRAAAIRSRQTGQCQAAHHSTPRIVIARTPNLARAIPRQRNLASQTLKAQIFRVPHACDSFCEKDG
jgi:hypothetical protein